MRQAGATQNARLTPMLNPVSFLATPPGTYPGRGLLLFWLQTAGRVSARNGAPAQGGMRIRLSVLCQLRHLRHLRHQGSLRLGAKQRGSPAGGLKDKALHAAPEYFQSRIALKQRTVENVHSQRF